KGGGGGGALGTGASRSTNPGVGRIAAPTRTRACWLARSGPQARPEVQAHVEGGDGAGTTTGGEEGRSHGEAAEAPASERSRGGGSPPRRPRAAGGGRLRPGLQSGATPGSGPEREMPAAPGAVVGGVVRRVPGRFDTPVDGTGARWRPDKAELPGALGSDILPRKTVTRHRSALGLHSRGKLINLRTPRRLGVPTKEAVKRTAGC